MILTCPKIKQLFWFPLNIGFIENIAICVAFWVTLNPLSHSQEAWFFMRIGNSYKEKEATKESLSLEASMSVDPALRASLTDEDGLLRPGALPKIATASAQGNKAILDSMDKAGHWV